MAVGSFHVGSMVDRQLRAIMMMAVTPLAPVLIALHAQGRPEQLRRVYLRGGRLALWAILAIVVPVAAFAPELVSLYLRERSAQYGDAALVMALLLACYPMMYAKVLLGRVAVAKAQLRAFMLIMLVSEVSNVLLTLYFVGKLGLGAVGSALSTFVVATIADLAGYWPLSLVLLELRFDRFVRATLLPGLLPALFAASCCLFMRSRISPGTWLELGFAVACVVAVYAIVLIGFCLQREDKADLLRLWSAGIRVVTKERKGETT